ncbi:crotonyl-CoA carboxylase/reductase [Sphaerisporangium aureirubrum]|uniref:Crotonyl-CoA carboxylase/reductase n=1 Tax=Sphaerisporangium aureirubrum TaxID=1544736 RepID=A0ABW1NPJ3_9ACTN
MSALAEAVLAGASGAELLACEPPERTLAAYLRRSDTGMFAAARDKDVTRSIRVGEVALPEPLPGEVLIAVMAGAINYNTVWSAMFEPVPTFRFLEAFARTGPAGARHDLPYHVIGSDASGVVVRAGAGVRRWAPGDRVVVSPVHVDEHDPAVHADGMMAADQRAWGFETNFGGLAHFAVVRATQLLPKPRHLTWEEAACNTLCLGTAYRMLAGPRGAVMKQGDVVLIWGAAGGLGGYAVQLVRNGGGVPVAVVGSARKAELVSRLGCDHVIDRAALGLGDGDGPGTVAGWRALGREIRRLAGEDPHIVFEHIGRPTFAASVYVARRGGVVVTCGSSGGYLHEYDNRYLWMSLKRVIGSHAANYQETWEATRLLSLGMIVPTLSAVHPLPDVAKAARAVQLNEHVGKVGVLCLAPREGLGVDDPAMRDRVGEPRLRLFRDTP